VNFFVKDSKLLRRAGILIVQMVQLEKALDGCCPGISAAVACFRTCWELKLARRKRLRTEPRLALFCALGETCG